MFSQNHIVSVRQMKRLLVLDLFAGTGLILPMVAGRLSGLSGVFAIAAGGAAAGVFALFLLNTVKDCPDGYPGFCQEILGRWPGHILMGIYALRYFATGAILLAVFAQIVNHTFLTDIPRAVLGTAMLALCIYCVFKGLETRARLGEMLMYFVIIPIVLIILLAIPQIHPDRLWPIEFLGSSQSGKYTQGPGGLPGFLWTCAITFALFSVVEWLLFLRPSVKKMEKACKGAVTGILWPVLLNILILTVCIGIFSVEGMNNEQWPTVVLMQIVRFPGGFLSRQDGLMLAFWMLGMFMLISGNIHYGMESFRSLNKKLCKPWFVVFPAVLILAIFFSIYLTDATRVFIRYMLFVYMPLALIPPVLLRIVQILRPGRRAGQNSGHRPGRCKKGVMVLALLLGTAFLGGCTQRTEIEDRNFVMCMGIDAREDHLSVSYGFPDLKALTGDGDNIHYPTVTISGKDMESIEAAFGKMSDKRLDYGQLQVIVFGNDMIRDSQMMTQVLEYIQKHQEFTRTVLVCMADEKAQDIVALDETVNGSIGVYLKQMFENNLPDYELTIGDLIIGMSLPEEPGEIAVVSPGDSGPKVTGMETLRGCGLSNEEDR